MISIATKLFKLVFAGALLAMFSGPVNAQMEIPGDVEDTCRVPNKTFNSWFVSGSPSLNGAVFGADSTKLPKPISGCTFYQWGAQMFLWMTSPEGDHLVLDGHDIFTVTPVDSDGNRHFIANPSDAGVKTAIRNRKSNDIGEIRQAGGGGVLMSQGKSLVYYGIHANDVYAYFLTGQKDGDFPDATKYPRNSADIDTLNAYVKTNFPDVDLRDSVTMVMEFKTSWVDAATLADASQYVTLDADVPAYTPNADNTIWTPTGGTEKKTLALVGMHVVGTVENHPEFVWATFEHVANAPNANFYYKDSKSKRVRRDLDSSGDYLFAAPGTSLADANVACMKQKGDGTIVAHLNADKTPVCDGGIVPSSTARAFPWGSPANGETDVIVQNNTLLLSVNNSVIDQLTDGDVRKNYVQIGSVWTAPKPRGLRKAKMDKAGKPRRQHDRPSPDAPIPTQGDHFNLYDMRGSLTLSNATMETYHQGSSCFDCHKLSADAKTSFDPFELLHIYSQILPLDKPAQ